jgi:hypothetical protein
MPTEEGKTIVGLTIIGLHFACARNSWARYNQITAVFKTEDSLIFFIFSLGCSCVLIYRHLTIWVFTLWTFERLLLGIQVPWDVTLRNWVNRSRNLEGTHSLLSSVFLWNVRNHSSNNTVSNPTNLQPGQHRRDNHKYRGFNWIFSFVITHLQSWFLYNFGLITCHLLAGFYALLNFSHFTFLFRFRFLDH